MDVNSKLSFEARKKCKLSPYKELYQVYQLILTYTVSNEKSNNRGVITTPIYKEFCTHKFKKVR